MSVRVSLGPYVRPLALSKNRRRTYLIARPGLFPRKTNVFLRQAGPHGKTALLYSTLIHIPMITYKKSCFFVGEQYIHLFFSMSYSVVI